MNSKRAEKLAAIFPICLAVLLWCGGCSKEESPQTPGDHYQETVTINKAPRGKAEPYLTDAEGEQEEEVSGTEELFPAPMPLPSGEPSGVEEERKAEAQDEVADYYVVKKGERLSSIAARDDVYGDPLKWPLLYAYNSDKIGELQLVDMFLNMELPEGERLRIITPGEAQENLCRKAGYTYAVNVLSARTQKGLIPSAIRLMREGYPVYITSATVKETQWMRLRVGFFKSKLEADLERRKINALLRIRNSWVAKVEQEELEEFGGYLKSK